MGKPFFAALILLLSLCAGCAKTEMSQTDAGLPALAEKGPPARELLARFMSAAMADGKVKIAVLVNQVDGDSSRQFLDGCVVEGRTLGFTVDAFVTGGDAAKCREIAGGIARADYDGLIFTNILAAGMDENLVGFSYDILKPIADVGIQIVTFETLPFHEGKSIKGLFTTFQDDYHLARLSLATLVLDCNTRTGRPARVIRIGCNSNITFLDRRAWVFGEFIRNRQIEELAFISLNGLENPHASAWEKLAEILPRFPPGSVDALWVPWDEFAKGCAEALASAERQDIRLFSIGISNDGIRLMQRHSQTWIATAAGDTKLAGAVNMRILAAKFAGEPLPDTFSFEPRLVRTADLNRAVNVENPRFMIPGWNSGQGLFDNYQWMIRLKAAGGKAAAMPLGAPLAAPFVSNPAAQ
jgi:simple sugar transport system substrate-binding protein